MGNAAPRKGPRQSQQLLWPFLFTLLVLCRLEGHQRRGSRLQNQLANLHSGHEISYLVRFAGLESEKSDATTHGAHLFYYLVIK
jgi:hypothetical protein